MRFDMWKSKAQKGAFLVFTALMIPIIFLCAGFAVDLGNKWAYTSKLQNASDAAALAGAFAYARSQNMDEKDTKNLHSYADTNARKYISANLFNNDDNLVKDVNPNYEVFKKADTDKKYPGRLCYRVDLTEEIPATFARIIGVDSLTVKVHSVALIPSLGGNAEASPLDNLINVGNGMYGSYYNGNNDLNNTIRGPVFEGNVVTYDKDFYDRALGQDWSKPNYRFFTQAAKDSNMKRGDLDKDNTGKYWHDLQYGGGQDTYDRFVNQMNQKIESMFNSARGTSSIAVYQNTGDLNYHLYLPSGNNSKNIDYYQIEPKSNDNFELHLRSMPGDTTKPVYVYIKTIPSMIKIYIDENIEENKSRPIIICHPGQKGRYETITFEGQAKDFTGTIYTPYSNLMPAHISGDNSIFDGQIFCQALDLEEPNGSYNIKKYGIFNNGNSQGSGGGSSGEGSDKAILIE